MKTTIGGDRLGSGNKQNLSYKNYERSTHDVSSLWRSSMASGTLVPFMNLLALPGDTFEIDLNCEVVTLPTIGPLFGSYKVQLDIFEVPLRLYNAKLHMNKLGVGMDMSEIYLPQIGIATNNHADYVQTFEDNEQVNPSSLIKYLGYSGSGYISNATNPCVREINACSLLAYWDIYKNYYANKQEEIGYFVHTDSGQLEGAMTPRTARLFDSDDNVIGIVYNATENLEAGCYCIIQYPLNASEPDAANIVTTQAGGADVLSSAFTSYTWDDVTKTMLCETNVGGVDSFKIDTGASPYLDEPEETIYLESFALTNIDDMRTSILQYAGASAFVIDESDDLPYSCFMQTIGSDDEFRTYSVQYSQEGLGIKTYQSDLFNNWIDTDWIDGVDGISELTEIDTSGGSFTMDTLNLAKKVYVLLNRIAVSGGTYDDWLDAVYTHERTKGIESPVYCGGLIKELAFEEVVSTAESGDEALGTLAGRGSLTQKHKGGKVVVKTAEPSVILGIVSLTPRVEYSQGNDWTVNLKTFDDFHKPGLDAIGFQDLITGQLLWTDDNINSVNSAVTHSSIGKQPAWINYMTDVNRCYGNFADKDKDMFMVLNRRYENLLSTGNIVDATTYIDPTKFNQIFAYQKLDAQNFWVHIAKNITTRRKMSATVIPNL